MLALLPMPEGFEAPKKPKPRMWLALIQKPAGLAKCWPTMANRIIMVTTIYQNEIINGYKVGNHLDFEKLYFLSYVQFGISHHLLDDACSNTYPYISSSIKRPVGHNQITTRFRCFRNGCQTSSQSSGPNGQQARNWCSHFQMSLHYTRYNKADYEVMLEWKLTHFQRC